MANEMNQVPGGANSEEVQAAVNQAMKAQKKKKKKKKLIIFGIILLVIIIGVIIANQPKDYDFDNPVAQVTVDTLLNDFSTDAANASGKYSDQVIAVTGQVGSIQDTYACIRAYDDDNWLYDVNVYMENSDDLKSFKVGDTITIEGVCDDTTLFGDVDVRQCIITDKFAVTPDYDSATEVSINDLVKAYKDNQVSADDKYKGKTIKFTGKITNVTDDYAVAEPANTDAWDWDSDVQICFEDVEELKKVSEGKEVTIVGECYGKGDVYTVKVCRAIVK